MPSILQSALHPAGVQAERIADLWWLLFALCAVVYIVVMGAVLVAVRRARASEGQASERQLTVSVATATGFTIVTLFVVLFASVLTGRAVASLDTRDALVVDVTGNQWWWHVVYDHPDPSLRITTANELHLPAGRPVVVRLRSNDVIHSFWVPNLHGKIDLIPGRENRITLRPDAAGVYRGQCAEYCGLQHANMAFTVVVEPSDSFERWVAAQRQPAPDPQTAEQQRGRQVVESGPCAMCHTVRGTLAGGRMGPDLTHVRSRSTIAAGTTANTTDALAAWIADPQHLKPGSRMPSTGLSPSDLQALVAYLETLR